MRSIAGYVAAATSEGFPEEWDLDQLWRAFRQLYPGGTHDRRGDRGGGRRAGRPVGRFLTEIVQQDAQAAYDRREEELTPEVMRELERRVVLSVLDRKWREHLYEMDYLRDGIGLRAWAQRDPLVEYQREGFDMFSEMMEGIKEESVGSLFNLQVQTQEGPIVEEADPGTGPQPGTAPAGTAVNGSRSGRPRSGRAVPPRAAAQDAPGCPRDSGGPRAPRARCAAAARPPAVQRAE